MIAVTIEATAGQELLRVVGQNLGDMTVPFRTMGEAALEDARGQIISQGALMGGGWAGMSPLTNVVSVVLYQKGRDPRTLLYANRGLLNSLTPEGSQNILEAGPDSLKAGTGYTSSRTGFPIAKGQQEGTSRTYHVLGDKGFSPTGIPARQILGWREARFTEFQVLLAEHVLKGRAA